MNIKAYHIAVCACAILCANIRALSQEAHFSSIVRGWQRRARSVRIGLHGLRMVQGVACCVHWRAVREVANGVSENGPWQRRSWSVWVRSDGLRVVDGVACPVHGSAIWQVASDKLGQAR